MAEEEVQEKKSGGKGLIIVLIVIMFLMMIGMGVLAYLLLSANGDSKEEGAEETEVHASAEHGEGDYGEGESHAQEYSPKYKQFEAPPPGSPPMYFTMDKFVVNFNGEGQAQFLAVDLKFMSYYPQVVSETGEMENLRPILKNDIQRILRNQKFSELNVPEGPDKLREEVLKTARAILDKHNIYPDLLEDVYMTRFVMQ